MTSEMRPLPDKDTCKDALSEIYTFLDGEITTEVRAKIAVHLDDCPPCGDIFQFEAELRRVISTRCQEEAPAALRERIAKSLGLDPGPSSL